MNNSFEIVAEIIEDIADIPRDEIAADSSLIDGLDLSSLELMSIISEISRKYSISISGDQMLEFETVNDIVKYIDSKTK